VWALSRLLPREKLASLAQRYRESDAAVQEEWSAALV
jgi:hypothetical protein